MYSYEIDNIMHNNNYKISSSLYIDICRNSPQIIYVGRKSDTDYYIATNDGYNWLFELYCDTETFL